MEKLTNYEKVTIKLILKAYQREKEKELDELEKKTSKNFLDNANYPYIKNEIEQIKKIIVKL